MAKDWFSKLTPKNRVFAAGAIAVLLLGVLAGAYVAYNRIFAATDGIYACVDVDGQQITYQLNDEGINQWIKKNSSDPAPLVLGWVGTHFVGDATTGTSSKNYDLIARGECASQQLSISKKVCAERLWERGKYDLVDKDFLPAQYMEVEKEKCASSVPAPQQPANGAIASEKVNCGDMMDGYITALDNKLITTCFNEGEANTVSKLEKIAGFADKIGDFVGGDDVVDAYIAVDGVTIRVVGRVKDILWLEEAVKLAGSGTVPPGVTANRAYVEVTVVNEEEQPVNGANITIYSCEERIMTGGECITSGERVAGHTLAGGVNAGMVELSGINETLNYAIQANWKSRTKGSEFKSEEYFMAPDARNCRRPRLGSEPADCKLIIPGAPTGEAGGDYSAAGAQSQPGPLSAPIFNISDFPQGNVNIKLGVGVPSFIEKNQNNFTVAGGAKVTVEAKFKREGTPAASLLSPFTAIARAQNAQLRQQVEYSKILCVAKKRTQSFYWVGHEKGWGSTDKRLSSPYVTDSKGKMNCPPGMGCSITMESGDWNSALSSLSGQGATFKMSGVGYEVMDEARCMSFYPGTRPARPWPEGRGEGTTYVYASSSSGPVVQSMPAGDEVETVREGEIQRVSQNKEKIGTTSISGLLRAAENVEKPYKIVQPFVDPYKTGYDRAEGYRGGTKNFTFTTPDNGKNSHVVISGVKEGLYKFTVSKPGYSKTTWWAEISEGGIYDLGLLPLKSVSGNNDIPPPSIAVSSVNVLPKFEDRVYEAETTNCPSGVPDHDKAYFVPKHPYWGWQCGKVVIEEAGENNKSARIRVFGYETRKPLHYDLLYGIPIPPEGPPSIYGLEHKEGKSPEGTVENMTSACYERYGGKIKKQTGVAKMVLGTDIITTVVKTITKGGSTAQKIASKIDAILPLSGGVLNYMGLKDFGDFIECIGRETRTSNVSQVPPELAATITSMQRQGLWASILGFFGGVFNIGWLN